MSKFRAWLASEETTENLKMVGFALMFIAVTIGCFLSIKTDGHW